MFNSISLAFSKPDCITVDPDEKYVLELLGYGFTLIFSVEFLVKCMAYGVIYGPEAYVKSGWNRLDGTIVLVSWADLALILLKVEGGPLMKLLKVFRMFRALRPLRAINKLPALKKV